MRHATAEQSRRIAERNWRDERDEGAFEVRSSRFLELQNSIVTRWLMPDTMLPPISPVPPFPLVAHRSRLARHTPRPVTLADFFSILLKIRNRIHHQLEPGRDGFLPVLLFLLTDDIAQAGTGGHTRLPSSSASAKYTPSTLCSQTDGASNAWPSRKSRRRHIGICSVVNRV